MATFKRFEDIEAWQHARILCNEVQALVTQSDFSKDFGLVRQIKNASGSTMDNIVEGFEREGNAEFKHFLTIAKGSCGETQSQLYRALDCKYITDEEFKKVYDIAEQTKALLKGLINYLKKTDFKGNKFNN